jgi:hypothetical protein
MNGVGYGREKQALSNQLTDLLADREKHKKQAGELSSLSQRYAAVRKERDDFEAQTHRLGEDNSGLQAKVKELVRYECLGGVPDSPAVFAARSLRSLLGATPPPPQPARARP